MFLPVQALTAITTVVISMYMYALEEMAIQVLVVLTTVTIAGP